jgi:hypothetical protein
MNESLPAGARELAEKIFIATLASNPGPFQATIRAALAKDDAAKADADRALEAARDAAFHAAKIFLAR